MSAPLALLSEDEATSLEGWVVSVSSSFLARCGIPSGVLSSDTDLPQCVIDFNMLFCLLVVVLLLE